MEVSSTPSRPLGLGLSRRTDTTRPWTGQSRPGTTRPGTARPQTAASTRYEGGYVIALVESCGVAHEVGIAAMDKETARVMLVQVGRNPVSLGVAPLTSDLGRAPVLHRLKLADCPTCIKTLHQMHIHYPSLVLVLDTFIAPTTPGHQGQSHGLSLHLNGQNEVRNTGRYHTTYYERTRLSPPTKEHGS